MAVCQKLVPLVNIKIAGKWMFIPLKMVLIGIDPYPYPSCLIIFDPKILMEFWLEIHAARLRRFGSGELGGASSSSSEWGSWTNSADVDVDFSSGKLVKIHGIHNWIFSLDIKLGYDTVMIQYHI